MCPRVFVGSKINNKTSSRWRRISCVHISFVGVPLYVIKFQSHKSTVQKYAWELERLEVEKWRGRENPFKNIAIIKVKKLSHYKMNLKVEN